LANACFIEFLLPQSSDKVQPCDVMIFGPMTANVSQICPAAEAPKQSKQVLKILEPLQTTLLPQFDKGSAKMTHYELSTSRGLLRMKAPENRVRRNQFSLRE
jgi:hypothetical protein